ncbi:MAG TPA: hypothetical protein VKQ72_22540 [Aggregatilineales bacterium]|nr:hypothetical protein [Aggregatilineales bacterium]
MYHSTRGLIELFARFPKLGGLIGLLIAGAFGVLGVGSWQQLREMPDQPALLTLSDAAEQLHTHEQVWVQLSGVEWDCGNLVDETLLDGSHRTEVIFWDQASAVWGVALFSGQVRCRDLNSSKASGILTQMEAGFFDRLSQRGFDLTRYQGEKVRLNLCTFCGPANSTLGVVIGIIFVPIGLAMYPMCKGLQRYYRNKNRAN